jgi:hypothetical protein
VLLGGGKLRLERRERPEQEPADRPERRARSRGGVQRLELPAHAGG